MTFKRARLGAGAISLFLAYWTIPTASAQYTVLHSFSPASGTVSSSGPGNQPNGAVVLNRDYGGYYADDTMYGATSAGGQYSGGVLYKFSGIPGFQSYSDIHDFGNAKDGKLPVGALALDAAGNIYGVTEEGGKNQEANDGKGGGMLWEYTTTGQYKDLHDFGATGDGVLPQAGVTIDSNGNLFGTTSEGGAHEAGIIWEIPFNGTYMDIHDFGGTVEAGAGTASDGTDPLADLTVSSQNVVYGTASEGGGFGGGCLWSVEAGGAYHYIASFGQGIFGVGSTGAVAVDSAGNIFGTNVSGGANGHGILFEVNASRDAMDLHDFGKDEDGSNPHGGVVVDSHDNVFGTTYSGGKHDEGNLWLFSTSRSSYVDIQDFGGESDAAGVYSSLAMDVFGDIFGIGTGGGDNGGGAMFAVGMQATGLNYNKVPWGTTVTGAINLLGPAYADTSFTLSASSADVTMPASVTVLAGHQTATFSITGKQVSSTTEVDINATSDIAPYAWYTGSSLTIVNPQLLNITMNPASVVGGSSTVATVKFASPVGSQGEPITLKSNDTAVSDPGAVTMPAGESSANFSIATKPVSSNTSIVISAVQGTQIVSQTLTVEAAAPGAIGLSESSVVGGGSLSATVHLTGEAGPSGVKVALKSSRGDATVPDSVQVPAGSLTASFDIKTVGVNSATVVTLTATANQVSKTASFTIELPALYSLTLAPTSATGGENLEAGLHFDGVAGPAGATVTLNSSNAAVVVPPSVKVPAQASSFNFLAKTAKVAKSTTVTLTATFAGVSKTATVTLTP